MLLRVCLLRSGKKEKKRKRKKKILMDFVIGCGFIGIINNANDAQSSRHLLLKKSQKECHSIYLAIINHKISIFFVFLKENFN